MKKTILFLIMLLTTVCSWGTTQDSVVEYDLWIRGERVTSEKYEFDDAWVRYDAETNTLYLNDRSLVDNSDKGYAIWNKIPDLKIRVSGTCELDGERGAIFSSEHFTIVGRDVFYSHLKSTKNYVGSCVIYAEKGMTIKDCDVALYSSGTGIIGSGTLSIDGAKLYTICLGGFDDVTFSNNSYLRSPKGVQYQKGNMLGDANNWVQIDVEAKYGLSVAGTRVTNENADDILGDQKVSYEPQTNTLKLNNCEISDRTSAAIIISTMDKLNIAVIGNNVLTTGTNHCIEGKNIRIVGYTPSKSSLKLQNKANETLVTASINGYVIIKNCTVTGPTLKNKVDESRLTVERARINVSNIEGFDEVIRRNAYVKTPTEVRYNQTDKYYITRGGAKVTSLQIEPYLLVFNGKDVTSTNIETQSGEVSYDAANRILTMKDCKLASAESTITGFKFYDDTTINLEGSNWYYASSSALNLVAGNLTIQGPGRLDIIAGSYALTVNNSEDDLISFGEDQSLTLDKATLQCIVSGSGWKVGIGSVIFNVKNSNFSFSGGAELPSNDFMCKKINLEGCKMILPEAFDLNVLNPAIVGEVRIQVPGDLNRNAKLDVSDITAMISYLKDGASNTPIPVLDVNEDGLFTKEDVEALAEKIIGK